MDFKVDRLNFTEFWNLLRRVKPVRSQYSILIWNRDPRTFFKVQNSKFKQRFFQLDFWMAIKIYGLTSLSFQNFREIESIIAIRKILAKQFFEIDFLLGEENLQFATQRLQLTTC